MRSIEVRSIKDILSDAYTDDKLADKASGPESDFIWRQCCSGENRTKRISDSDDSVLGNNAKKRNAGCEGKFVWLDEGADRTVVMTRGGYPEPFDAHDRDILSHVAHQDPRHVYQKSQDVRDLVSAIKRMYHLLDMRLHCAPDCKCDARQGMNEYDAILGTVKA